MSNKNLTNDFPSYLDVKKAIEKLRTTNFPKFTEYDNIESFVKDIDKLLVNEFKILPDIKTRLNARSFKLPIFRVRELNSNFDTRLFAEHSYPPVNLTGYGRCNLPKRPVFYAATNPLVALSEIVKQGNYQDKEFCISKWKIIESDKDIVVQSFDQMTLNKETIFNDLKSSLINRINEPFEGKLDEDQSRAILLLLEFLHQSFIDDNNYTVSSYIANRALYTDHNFPTNIILYPSVQTKLNHINLAMHPNFVDNQLQIERLYKLKLNHLDIDKGIYNITLSRYAVIDNNSVIWKLITPEDQTYKGYVKEDFPDMSIDEKTFTKE